MVTLELYKSLDIKVTTDNVDYLKGLQLYFTHYVDGFIFNPKYKAGMWDGTISLFNVVYRTFPYGLIREFLKYHNLYHKSEKISFSNELKSMFILSKDWVLDSSNKPNWDLRDYQQQAIEKALEHKYGILRVATGGGKSFIIYCILRSLFSLDKIQHPIIIVPNISLVAQFKENMLEYGFDESEVGVVFADEKQWDKKIIISTWQSLANYKDKLDLFDCVIVDETQISKAQVLTDLLRGIVNAKYRIGCTGTLPESTLDQLQVKSYLGPVLYEISAAELQMAGVLAQCMINVINIPYEESIRGSYDEIKDTCFKHSKRLTIIRKIVSDIKKGPILILVGKVESEGKFLEDYFNEISELKDREIVFISGKDNLKKRELYRKKCINEERIILISTYPIFQAGIDIPCLEHVMFASSFKSKIRILQSIGRALRKYKSKNIAQIYDIVDCVDILEKHSSARKKFYRDEEFLINDINIK